MNLWSFVNEEKIAQDLLKNKKSINTNTREKIISYIKYLKKEGKTKNQIRNELDDFMTKNYNGFIMGDWDDRLQKLVNKYSKKENCEYKKSKTIIITKKELEFISNIGDVGGVKAIEIEKVLYCMLVLAKSTYLGEDRDIWCNYDSQDIFKLARFKYKKSSNISYLVQRESLIYDLNNFKKNILELGGKNIKLLYGEKQIKEDNTIISVDLDEKTAENMIVNYLNWKQLNNYNYCKVCGKEIKQNKNNTVGYCNNCSKKIKRIQTNLCKRKKDE
jgi:predicted RNA-binding Zn-ribbon protein involved in translation (DUF1610 family)